MIRGRNGPAVLHLANIGRQAAAAARRIAPRSAGPGPHMADEIDFQLVPRRGSWAVQVVADSPYALFVHEGTKPHDIGSPVFIQGVGWRYIGRSPSGKGKPHPGTRANPFLLNALRLVGLPGRRA